MVEFFLTSCFFLLIEITPSNCMLVVDGSLAEESRMRRRKVLLMYFVSASKRLLKGPARWLTIQACQPEFSPQNLHKSRIWCTYV